MVEYIDPYVATRLVARLLIDSCAALVRTSARKAEWVVVTRPAVSAMPPRQGFHNWPDGQTQAEFIAAYGAAMRLPSWVIQREVPHGRYLEFPSRTAEPHSWSWIRGLELGAAPRRTDAPRFPSPGSETGTRDEILERRCCTFGNWVELHRRSSGLNFSCPGTGAGVAAPAWRSGEDQRSRGRGQPRRSMAAARSCETPVPASGPWKSLGKCP